MQGDSSGRGVGSNWVILGISQLQSQLLLLNVQMFQCFDVQTFKCSKCSHASRQLRSGCAKQLVILNWGLRRSACVCSHRSRNTATWADFTSYFIFTSFFTFFVSYFTFYQSSVCACSHRSRNTATSRGRISSWSEIYLILIHRSSGVRVMQPPIKEQHYVDLFHT